MTPSECTAFEAGLLLGIAATVAETAPVLAEVDSRLTAAEREILRPRPRFRLFPAGHRQGRPVFFVGYA